MSINQHTLDNHWIWIRSKLRERWGQISDDDFDRARGSIDHLIGMILQRTGAMRETVESFLEMLMSPTALSEDRGGGRRPRNGHVDVQTRRRKEWRELAEKMSDDFVGSALVALGSGFITGFALGYWALPHPIENQESAASDYGFRQMKRLLG